ncbi:MAG TPA: hypothetical protein VKR54_01765, partial [Candidatus Babeliales bacterium]|nr:hypothetical protein [Candidatus Babeliales bacterium]
EQQARITQIYGTLLKTDLTSSEQVQLKGRYEAVIAQLNDAIYEQQLITGDVMSTQRKILLGAAAAGTAAGLVLARQYFSTSDAAETTVDRAGMPEGAVVSVEVSQVSSEEINQQPIVEVIVEPTVETTVESTAVPTVPAVELTVESPVEPTELTVETTVESVEPTLPSTELKPSTEPMRLTPAEYFELHNPTIEAARRVAGAVGEAVRTGIKALPEAVNRVPVSEQEEYFVEKYGSEATQIISSKIEPGLETIKGKIKLSKE